MILQLLLALPLWAAPAKQVAIKAETQPEKTKWYQDLSVGAGLDFRRDRELNNEPDFKTRFTLLADRVWREKWSVGLQYSYDKNKTSSGIIAVETQNHEILARAQGRIYQFKKSVLWSGLSLGFDKNRIHASLGDSGAVRWSNWQWIAAPEISHRHGLYQNIWMQEVIAYTSREYSNQGEWSFALRFGLDLSNY